VSRWLAVPTRIEHIDNNPFLWTAGLVLVGHALGRIAQRMRSFD
jgi:hypothetical protein